MANRNENKKTYLDLGVGKIPPQAIELEEAVLGAILVEKGIYQDVCGLLSSNSFYKPIHQVIFEAIVELSNKRQPIDILSVSEQLRNTNKLEEIGGPIVLAQLTSKVGSGSHSLYHAKVIAEKFIKREFIRLGSELVNGMFDDSEDLLDLINTFDKSKLSILSFAKDEEKHISEAVNETVEYSIKLNKNEVPKGIPTGFKYFDDFSGGIQRGDLVIIAGEPSNGKTALSLDILRNSCSFYKSKGAIFSYEMTTFQLSARLLGGSEKVSSKDIIRGEIKEAQLKKISKNAHKLTNSDLYIIQPSGSGFAKLKQDISRMSKSYSLDFVVIDYLQLISNPKEGASQTIMVGDIANSLKVLAKDLNIGIILLSQLARNPQPRPTLSRLKYSGDIEAAADTVIFTYLPFKYGLSVENVLGESIPIGENAIIIVAKGRNIGITEFVLDFVKEIPAFYNHHANDDNFQNRDFSEPSKCSPF